MTVTATPTLLITPPSIPPSAGLPALYTFAVSNVANGRDRAKRIGESGDGTSQNLGAISGSQTVSPR